MRIKSAIWVMAHVRRCNAEGAMAVVARRGQEDAGAIYLKVNRLDGSAFVYAPAPAGMEGYDSERYWICASDEEPMEESAADAYLARQGEFDPDFWIIEIEDREGRHFLGDSLISITG